MSAEFAVIDASGKTIDTVDPYLSHIDLGSDTYLVDNGYDKYQMIVPPGGKFEIRAMEVEA